MHTSYAYASVVQPGSRAREAIGLEGVSRCVGVRVRMGLQERACIYVLPSVIYVLQSVGQGPVCLTARPRPGRRLIDKSYTQ